MKGLVGALCWWGPGARAPCPPPPLNPALNRFSRKLTHVHACRSRWRNHSVQFWFQYLKGFRFSLHGVKFSVVPLTSLVIVTVVLPCECVSDLQWYNLVDVAVVDFTAYAIMFVQSSYFDNYVAHRPKSFTTLHRPPNGLGGHPSPFLPLDAFGVSIIWTQF